MRKITFIATMLAAVLLTACHADIDVQNIDPAAEVRMGLAIPVGSMSAKMGDFLGDSTIEQISVGEDGIYHFTSRVEIPTKNYRKIDVASYVIKDETTLSFKIKPAIDDRSVITGDGHTVITLVFDLELGMQGINNNTTQERIDSIHVSEAQLISMINVTDFGLTWDEIQSVQLELGDQFRRSEGKTINIPISGKGYNRDIPIDVNDFSLSLMKDNTNPEAGTVSKIKFRILFNVCPADGHVINVSDESAFAYNLQVKVIDYEAIWGWFQAGNEMRDAQHLDMDSLWDEWKKIKKLKVRFAEPIVDVYVSHRVAAPLRMYIDYLSAVDSTGHETKATWEGKDKTDFALENSLSPEISTLNDSVYNHKRFSYLEHEGHLDRLFDVRPDSFNYSFHLLVDQNPRSDYPWKQHRITKDTKVHGYAMVDVPFKFNEGTELAYSMTIKDVDLSSFTLDSLMAESEILDTLKTSNLKLFLQVENSIPFDIEGVFTFLDKDSADMHLQLVQDNDSNRLHFPAPTMIRPAGQKYGYVSEPSKTVLIVDVEKNDFDRFAEIKAIRLDAAITGNPQPCVLDTTTSVRVRIGIAANVDAILNLDKIANQNK